MVHGKSLKANVHSKGVRWSKVNLKKKKRRRTGEEIGGKILNFNLERGEI